MDRCWNRCVDEDIETVVVVGKQIYKSNGAKPLSDYHDGHIRFTHATDPVSVYALPMCNAVNASSARIGHNYLDRQKEPMPAGIEYSTVGAVAAVAAQPWPN